MAAVVERQTIEEQQVGDQTEITTSRQVESPAASRATNKLIQVVYFIVGVINVLLALRLVLQLLGASRASGFVDFIYSLTEPLVAPFYGVFQTTVSYGVSRLELESLLAIVIYSLVAWGIASLIRLAK